MYTHILFIHIIKGIPLEGRRNGYLTPSIQIGREHTLEGRSACPIHQRTWKGENDSERESHTSLGDYLYTPIGYIGGYTMYMCMVIQSDVSDTTGNIKG